MKAKTRKNTAKRVTKRHSPAAKSARGVVEFLQKPTCTSCRNARAYMEACGFDLQMRDIGKNRLTAEEIEKLIGKSDYKSFLNTRNELYRQRKMKENPPSRAEAIRMIAEEPNLIRRPIIIAKGKIILGFDQTGIDNL
jgi:arsenate reductase (glutaredoxin)